MKKKSKQGKGKSNGIKRYVVEESTTLLPFLQKVLSHLSRNAVKSILTRGEVVVEGKAVTQHNHPLESGQTIMIYKDQKSLPTVFKGLTIIHEDQDLIVIEKESGLLSVSTLKENIVTAYRQLSDYVKAQHSKNRIFIVHRLDRDTSGVMIFAKSEHVKNKLQNSWKDMVKERTYIALVEGKVKKTEDTITSWLNETSTQLMYSSFKPDDGKKAVTHYKTIQSNQSFSLLEINLETGRKNQIRVHMKDIGHPIVGDKKYGANSNAIGRLGLHAKKISFVHPTKGDVLSFEAATPKHFMDKFNK